MTRKIKDCFFLVSATGLGLGYCPWAPGTWGTLLGIAVFFSLQANRLSWPTGLATVAALFFSGVWISQEASKIFQEKDSHKIVIDEIIGCFVFLLFIPQARWCIIVAFVLYRLFDVWKPFPARQSENLPGGWGIMTDDLIAAIYTIVVTNIIVCLKGRII